MHVFSNSTVSSNFENEVSSNFAKEFVYPSDGEHFRILYDTVDSKALSLIFYHNSQANTKENVVQIDKHPQRTICTTLCSDSVARDVIVQTLLGFAKLLMPHEQPDIFVRQIDLDSNSIHTLGNMSSDRKQVFVPSTGRNDVCIDGLTYDPEGDENMRLLYVRSLQTKCSEVVSLNQHLRMELEIAKYAFDEIKLLHSNQQESLQTVNEKLEVSHASFLIAEASKNDLALEIAQLRGVGETPPTDTINSILSLPDQNENFNNDTKNEKLNIDQECTISKLPQILQLVSKTIVQVKEHTRMSA